jgi:hypothetical protein
MTSCPEKTLEGQLLVHLNMSSASSVVLLIRMQSKGQPQRPFRLGRTFRRSLELMMAENGCTRDEEEGLNTVKQSLPPYS